MDSQPRRSTRRLILQTRQEYEIQQREQEERAASVRKRGLREREHSVDCRRREHSVSSDSCKKAKREDDLYHGISERQRVKKLHLRGGRLNQTDPLPLRRSVRERKLMYSTFNHTEIERQLLNQTALEVLRDSSEDEMEPYEKLLSPQRAGRRCSSRSLSSNKMLLRSSNHQERGEVVEEEEGSKEDQGGEEGVGGSKDDPNAESDQKVKSNEEEEEEAESTEQESENGEDTENSQAEYDGYRGYYLRKRRPVIYQYQPVIQVVDENTGPKPRRGRPRRSFYDRGVTSRVYQPRRSGEDATQAKRRIAAHQDSTTSCSDSDEARFQRRKARSMQHARTQCLPMNFAPEDVAHGVIRDRARVGGSLADVDPMTIDRSVTFDSVGGLQEHIKALKEMIVFPLLYAEVFERFKISPPRGVLFHGPPGCGKTLIARALANECSKGGKQVAFFMRKGADCLSKWVGESERQLRLLFDQAYQMRPSIIFFDEIDGLAPVRSSRQDQIHSSIVSTLLALMDGLDSRGEIVVIGATNRIDAIDPALRRPGRFDREFLFPLPSVEDRKNILAIHTKAWDPLLKPEFLAELAGHTGGYCGADLKALCTEAALHALRRCYPQIYTTTDKLVLDVSKIAIAAVDFHYALKRIVPTAQRSEASPASSLSPLVRPLLLHQLDALVSTVTFFFPLSWKALFRAQSGIKAALAAQRKEEEGVRRWIAESRSGEDTQFSPLCNGETQPAVPSSSSTDSKRSASGKGSKGRARVLSVSSNSSEGHKPLGKDCWEPQVTNLVPLISHGPSHLSVRNNQSGLPFYLSNTGDLDQIYFDMNEMAQVSETEPSISLPAVECGSADVSSPTGAQGGAAEAGPPKNSIQSTPCTATTYLSLSAHPHTIPQVHYSRVLLCGPPGMGQTSHLAPALLHALEDFPVRVIDMPTLYGSSTRSPEEACTQVFREAKRMSPSIIYLPRMSSWWEVTTDTFRETFLALVHTLPSSSPVLILATSEQSSDALPDGMEAMFSGPCEGIFTVHQPGVLARQMFFYEVLQKVLRPPPPKPTAIAEMPLEVLPVASNSVQRNLSQEELDRLENQRRAVMRELRIFLRDITNKLIAERKFKDFVNPVDCEEVPDYYDIVLCPMDLGTVMKKIDEHQYMTPKQWVEDIDQITRNALEYNPENDTESRLLRHRALALQDMAHSFLDHELSEEFEKQCEEVMASHHRLGSTGGNSPQAVDRDGTTCKDADTLVGGVQDGARRRLRQKSLNLDEEMGPPSVKDSLDASNTEDMVPSISSCSTPNPQTGSNCAQDPGKVSEQLLKQPQLAKKKATESGNGAGKRSITFQKCQFEQHLVIPVSVGSDGDGGDCQIEGIGTTGAAVGVASALEVQNRLISLFTNVVKATERSSIEELEHIHSMFEHLIFRSRFEPNKIRLLDDMMAAVNLFQRTSGNSY